MCVSLVGNDKEEITTLVNAVVDAYLNKVVVHEQEDKIGRVDKLETLRADKETEVRTALNNLRHLAEGTGGAEDKEALSVKQQVAVQQYAELSRELDAGAVRSDAGPQLLKDGPDPPGEPRRDGDSLLRSGPVGLERSHAAATGRQAGAVQADDGERQADGCARQQIGLREEGTARNGHGPGAIRRCRKGDSRQDQGQEALRWRPGDQEAGIRSADPRGAGTAIPGGPGKAGQGSHAHRQQFDRHRYREAEAEGTERGSGQHRHRAGEAEGGSSVRLPASPTGRWRTRPRTSTRVRCGWR